MARVLAVLDPAEAERQMRAYVGAAVTRGDYRGASVTTGRLADLCRASGRLAEALTLIEQGAGYTRQAGLGPWTQLAGEARRLQVLSEMGQADQVLAEVRRLRDRMQALPAAPGPDETMTPWNIRETLIDTGRYAARQLERWEDALDLNAANLASMRDRGAPAVETSRAMYNDYAPLLRLGRTGDALALLLECRRVFQDARDIQALGNTFSALADTEEARGHGDVAIGLERDALRYKYLAEDVTAIAVGYHNLGNYLRRHARQAAPALACHLAAVLIRAITGAEGSEDSVWAAVADLRALYGESDEDSIHAAAPGPGKPGPRSAPLASSGPPADATPYVDVPVDVPDLCRRVSEASGTDLAGLLAVPVSEQDALKQLYQEVVVAVREAASRGNGEDDATVPSGGGG